MKKIIPILFVSSFISICQYNPSIAASCSYQDEGVTNCVDEDCDKDNSNYSNDLSLKYLSRHV